MPKTVTIRLDDETYQMIRQAAEGQMRSISNFIEYATVSYLSENAFVGDDEMAEILSDPELTSVLDKARAEVSGGRYKIVE